MKRFSLRCGGYRGSCKKKRQNVAGDCCRRRNSGCSSCRSGLAREKTPRCLARATPVFAGKPAPTRIGLAFRF
ncbi:hypothetical protein C1S65_06440 [Pseudomonas putida]|uniref:Uncharacterized protein n=1 Tax=Pseudomonas putida TaxID=303 RepID=A0AAD0P9V1_PSEPU|nr:hypothetical protein C1S65_06440 [Pseudomonas putida]